MCGTKLFVTIFMSISLCTGCVCRMFEKDRGKKFLSEYAANWASNVADRTFEYEDSIGNSIVYQRFSEIKFYTERTIDCDGARCPQCYTHDLETREINLRSSSNPYEFKFNFTVQRIRQGQVYDVLNLSVDGVELKKVFCPDSINSCVYWNNDIPLWAVESFEYVDSIKLNNSVYDDVYLIENKDRSISNVAKFYLTMNQAVVGFELHDGIIWNLKN